MLLASSLGWGSCTFSSTGGPIAFGGLDPSVANTRTAFTDLSIKCTSAGNTPSWSFSGANGNAPLRMKYAAQSAFIPYSVSPSVVSVTGSNQVWRVTATVLGSDYQDAVAGGPYVDQLTATITP